MKFSKLRLNGFKSFVDPTDLIVAPGLTGVVGPNGCGKSNLLEALRWVMGENRPTAMRGGGMEDVIFAGASSRPARNFAEVSLFIDNAERLAPAGFNDADGLEVSRRITRDIGSAYRANGKEVRARDVQMLFADASTGSHSPSLVRQGQIAELINAKPRARRRILEEAAGISGLYQRRHEAELKLKGAEANMARVDDVLEQLASQLASLARQARQAARYREIGAELRLAEGMYLYRRWLEAAEARAAAEATLREALAGSASAETAARQAAKAREVAEGAVPPLREEDAIAAAVLQRLTLERQGLERQRSEAAGRIEALGKRKAQLERDIEREAGLSTDAVDSVAALEAEAEELTQLLDGHDAALAAAEVRASEAAEVLHTREADLSAANEHAARLAAQHQSAARMLSEAETAMERIVARSSEAVTALDTARGTVRGSEDAVVAAQAAEAEAAAHVERVEAELLDVEAACDAAQGREGEARAARAEAEGEAGALKAEMDAVARLVAREAGGGAQILDELRVEDGFEKALGAALSDDLKLPRQAAAGQSGWRGLPAYDDALALPAGAVPLAGHVTLPDVLARRMACVGVVDPADGPRLQADLRPGQRLVSRAGDLWRWDGYTLAAADAPSAAALRLEQENRLKRLTAEEAVARAKAEAARAAHEALVAEAAELTAALTSARQARRAADQASAEAAKRLSRVEADRNVAEGKVQTLELAVARFREEEGDIALRRTEAERAKAALADLDHAKAALEDVKLTVEAARVTMLAHRASFDELRRTGEARETRRATVRREIESWRKRLETADTRSGELRARRDTTEAELKAAMDAPAQVEAAVEALLVELERAETRRKAASDALAEGETALRQAVEAERARERDAGTTRETRAAAQARFDASQDAVAAAEERIVEGGSDGPEALLEALACEATQIPGISKLEADIARLKRQRDALGAVNLRAEEDAKTIEEERSELAREKDDLEAAIATLRSGIAGLNKEGRERLLAAFEEVNRNFSRLFTHLFNGGEAKLVLVESDDPLEAGLEIMCQPPGKKLSTLSLLSGGEQTLTALALIFAVFLANPAPICVLDEVDAPLDDANVTRFCNLLDEMTRVTETRFLIITHHAVTMSRMDRLFGVTMQEQGVSQLVSVDLTGAEKLVA
ncbi:MAG: AAA family ATPase [Pseudomonadota bacterium]